MYFIFLYYPKPFLQEMDLGLKIEIATLMAISILILKNALYKKCQNLGCAFPPCSHDVEKGFPLSYHMVVKSTCGKFLVFINFTTESYFILNDDWFSTLDPLVFNSIWLTMPITECINSLRYVKTFTCIGKLYNTLDFAVIDSKHPKDLLLTKYILGKNNALTLKHKLWSDNLCLKCKTFACMVICHEELPYKLTLFQKILIFFGIDFR